MRIDPTGTLERAATPITPPTKAPSRATATARALVRRGTRVLSTRLQRLRWMRARPVLIAAYMAENSVRKLQVGSGPVVLQGWLNADLRPRRTEQIFMDATEPWPFPDRSFDYVLAEHFIGDLTYAQCQTMLKECYRVLRPGGRLRVITPCLSRLAGLYAPIKTDIQRRYIRWVVTEFMEKAHAELEGFVINHLFGEVRFIYDAGTLRHILTEANFSNITECDFGRSEHRELDGIDSHGRVVGDPDIAKFESLVFEATR